MKKLILGAILGSSLTGMVMNNQNISLTQQLEAKQVEMNRLGNQVAELKLANNELKIENAQLYFENKWTSLGQYKITYYWPGEDEWGSMTSTGVIAQEGITIAADPEIIPYGTEVKINGHIYVVQDTGSALIGKKIIDIYVEEPLEEMYYTEVFVRGN